MSKQDYDIKNLVKNEKGFFIKGCGCKLAWKIRSESKCPLFRW